MKAILVFLITAASLNAFAQVESGTFVVLNASQSEMIVAADSRSILDGGVKKDDRCKITALGNELIFADAGMTGGGSGEAQWDSHAIARDLFLRLSRESAADDFLTKLAIAWGKEIQGKVLASAVPRRPTGEPNGRVLMQAVFGEFIQNEPNFVTVSIRYRVNSDLTVNARYEARPYKGSGASIALGDGALAAELDQQKTPRVLEWKKRLPKSGDPLVTKSVGEVQFAIANSPRAGPQSIAIIAGDIDVVKLTPTKGIEWLKRKPNCPSN